MSCQSPGTVECDTVQIIEPKDDLLVDTANTRSDMDERGEVELVNGQTSAVIIFAVPKLNAFYHFEYLYIDAMGNTNPGGIQIVPTVRAIEGFAVLFAGLPIGAGYVLHWRVVVTQTSSLVQIDAPEDLYLQMPHANLMAVTFVNPRSNTNYGFTELRVENLTDPPAGQALIGVQVVTKTTGGFVVAVNPMPPTNFYFLRVRTP